MSLVAVVVVVVTRVLASTLATVTVVDFLRIPATDSTPVVALVVCTALPGNSVDAAANARRKDILLILVSGAQIAQWLFTHFDTRNVSRTQLA